MIRLDWKRSWLRELEGSDESVDSTLCCPVALAMQGSDDWAGLSKVRHIALQCRTGCSPLAFANWKRCAQENGLGLAERTVRFKKGFE